MSTDTIITVIGMGKLGLPMAAFYARSGYKVYGLDINEDLVNGLLSGSHESSEPGLKESLAAHHILFTSDYSRCIPKSSIIVVLVETPIAENELHNLQPLFKCIDMVKEHINCEKEDRPTVCISSTVLPGTAQQVQEKFEDTATVISLPSLATIGRIAQQLCQEPFSVIIGTEHGEATTEAKEIRALWERCCVGAKFTITNFANAELSKLLFLAYLNHQVSFGSLVSELCENVPDGDAEVVLEIMSKDPRVNTSYMHPGIGAGGPCLPRDTKVLSQFAHQTHTDALLLDILLLSNAFQVLRAIDKVIKLVEVKCKVAVLGLTYKPGYQCLESSQGVALVRLLRLRGYIVGAYDLLFSEGVHDGVQFNDIETVLEDASLAVICHDDSRLDAALNANIHLMKSKNVISVFRHERHNANYYFIGKA